MNDNRPNQDFKYDSKHDLEHLEHLEHSDSLEQDLFAFEDDGFDDDLFDQESQSAIHSNSKKTTSKAKTVNKTTKTKASKKNTDHKPEKREQKQSLLARLGLKKNKLTNKTIDDKETTKKTTDKKTTKQVTTKATPKDNKSATETLPTSDNGGSRRKKKKTYTSVKNRPTRVLFNQSSGASARADFAKDKSRYYTVWGIAFLLFLGLIARAVQVQIVNATEYQQIGEKFITSVRTVPSYRGKIIDRNEQALAVSAPLMSVSFSPNEYATAYYAIKQKMAKNPDDQELQQKMQARLDKMDLKILAKVTKVSLKKLQKATHISNNVDFTDDKAVQALIPTGKGSHYMPLLNKVPPETAEKVMGLGIAGIHQKPFFHRYYPQPYSSTQLLGYMGENAKDPESGYKGRAGLESQYDEMLAGKDGKVLVLRDAGRSALKEIKEIEQGIPGKDLQLTIDSRLQFLLYQELEKVGKKQRAMWSSGIIVDVDTGEILAMSSWPTYNANKLSQMSANGRNQRNRPLIDIFEPGSVVKPFTVAAALESGKYKANSKINTSPGSIKVKGYTIRDHKDLGVIGFTELLQHSSNVASTKIALKLPATAISDMQTRFGLGKKTGLNFPSEQAGTLITPKKSETTRRATLSYGYGLQVTLAQIAQAYATLGAGGVLHPLTLVKNDKDTKQHTSKAGNANDANKTDVQVISKEHALSIVKMMESVTEEGGTAVAAAIDGYRVAGKTGTSRRIDPKGGYYEDRYRTVFAGIAPVSKPKLAIVILVEDPRKNKYAGEVTAPVFHNVMKEALRLYNVPLDKPLIVKEEDAKKEGKVE